MAKFDYEIVGKIGSMALIRKDDNDMDYNIFSRVGAELRPGMIWISSGATEIGRLDYIKRTGHEILGDMDDIKTDYAAQGQSILMEQYRKFVPQAYSLRQLLVEHMHFNDPEKREHIRRFLLRCAVQNAIPIVNYNDPVSAEENRKMEIYNLQEHSDHVVECVDNDETAAVICTLVKSRYLIVLGSVDGIYSKAGDPSSLVEHISGKDADEVIANIRQLQQACIGTSRVGSNGARAKLEFMIEPVRQGTTVIIAHAQNRLSDIIKGNCRRTLIDVS
jgi:glutamate 5-kinase